MTFNDYPNLEEKYGDLCIEYEKIRREHELWEVNHLKEKFKLWWKLKSKERNNVN